MPDIDLYTLLKDYPDKPRLIKKLIFELIEKLLQNAPDLTDEQRGKLARLRSYIQINFKDF